jgi:peroxiredoxin Q/BCP
MRWIVLLTVLLLAAAPAAAVDVGDKAPEFEAESTAGTIRLSDYAGKKHVVLAFYYKDFTSG